MTGLLDQPTTTTKTRHDPFLLVDADMAAVIKAGNAVFEAEARARDEELVAAEVRQRLEVFYADHIEARRERSPETLKHYLKAFSAFALWCVGQHALPGMEGPRSLPARAETVACYIHALVESGKSHWQIRIASAAIQRAHRLAGHADPTDDPLVVGIIKAAREKTPPKKKRRRRKTNGASHH